MCIVTLEDVCMHKKLLLHSGTDHLLLLLAIISRLRVHVWVLGKNMRSAEYHWSFWLKKTLIIMSELGFQQSSAGPLQYMTSSSCVWWPFVATHSLIVIGQSLISSISWLETDSSNKCTAIWIIRIEIDWVPLYINPLLMSSQAQPFPPSTVTLVTTPNTRGHNTVKGFKYMVMVSGFIVYSELQKLYIIITL